jgi:hypothetical protein
VDGAEIRPSSVERELRQQTALQVELGGDRNGGCLLLSVVELQWLVGEKRESEACDESVKPFNTPTIPRAMIEMPAITLILQSATGRPDHKLVREVPQTRVFSVQVERSGLRVWGTE